MSSGAGSSSARGTWCPVRRRSGPAAAVGRRATAGGRRTAATSAPLARHRGGSRRRAASDTDRCRRRTQRRVRVPPGAGSPPASDGANRRTGPADREAPRRPHARWLAEVPVLLLAVLQLVQV